MLPVHSIFPRWFPMLVASLLFLAVAGCSSEPPEPEEAGVVVTFSNATTAPVDVIRLNEAEGEALDGRLEPGKGEDFTAQKAQIWRFRQADQVIGSYTAGKDLRQFYLIQKADTSGGVRSIAEEVADPVPAVPQLTPLRSTAFESTYDDPRIAFLPHGFSLPNVFLTMWSKESLYDLKSSSEFVLEFDATLTEPRQEVIIAFSENRLPWGAEGADALTFRVMPETQDVWIRTGFYEDWLNTRLYYNSSEEVIKVGEQQRYRLRLTPSDISISVDGKEIAGAPYDVAPVPLQGYVGFVAFGNGDYPEETQVTYENIAFRQTANRRDIVIQPEPVDGGNHPVSGVGRYLALVIGAEDYMDPAVNDLDFPIQDAKRMVETLTSHYTFARENITFLQNPSQADIYNALDRLRAEVQPQDNLLIFYAGHGYWDEDMEQGFWLPVDAEKDFRSKWLANSTLRNYLRAIKTKHTLLVSDACFSGGIFKTRDAFSAVAPAVEALSRLPSRKAMTSGTLKEVPDKSVFIEYLIKRLQDNDQPYLSSQALFTSLRDPVINNSPLQQVPQFGVVRETGDEGGEFVFRRRGG
ncbi:MAG TPA: caspase family protein [Rhodothermales bacterium]|nr:caspase family protein [Rhodothermales bacterium]